MDFITAIPVSKGFTVIMVVVDHLSKFGHFILLRTEFTSTMVADAFIHNVVKLQGIPKSIITDRDKTFFNNFWKHLFKAMGTILSMSSTYHPQSDGQTESLNKCVELYLQCFVSTSPRAWVNWLPWAQFCYNSSFHTSARMTPFRIVYGREPPTSIPYCSNEQDPPDVADLLQ